MDRKRVITILVSVLLSLGLLCGASGCGTPSSPAEPSVVPSTPPTVHLTPADLQVGPGDEFTVEVRVDPMGKGISAVEINLEFPRKMVAVRSVQPGPLLGPEPLTGVKNINNMAGIVQYAIARIGPTVVPTEPGTVAVMTFVVTAMEPGNYMLELRKAGLADEKFEDIPNVIVSSANLSVVSQEQRR